MTGDIARRRQQRSDFMTRLYGVVDASVNEFVSAFEIGTEMNIPDAEIGRVVGYLEEKGYIKVDDHKLGIIRITAAGIDYVEEMDAEAAGPVADEG
jgi:hypothetical protein